MSKIKVLIYGSCVSRDIVAIPAAADHIELVDYYARSTIASLAQPTATMVEISTLDLIKSPFQRRMVDRDLSKCILQDIKELNFDLLLIDFIDDRFDIWLDYDHRIATLSSELVQTGFPGLSISGRRIKSGGDEFFDMWKRGWQNFLTACRDAKAIEKIRVNRVRWSDRTRSGSSDFGHHYPAGRIQYANRFMDRLYEVAAQTLPDTQFIEYRSDELLAADEHRWGVSPFHYVPEFYQSALDAIISTARKELRADTPTCSSRSSHRDISKWDKALKIAEIEQLQLKALMTDGLCVVGRPDQVPMDLLIQGFGEHQSSGSFLVGFSGAVSNRSGKLAPFFSAVSLSTEIELPLLAISDPSLAMDGNLALSWYAGNSLEKDLPRRILAAIRRVSDLSGLRPILIGGSGGGYAALQIATLSDIEMDLVVWNPQTRISAYLPKAVQEYLQVAFPELPPATPIDGESQREVLADMLKLAGVKDGIQLGQVNPNVRVVYLQNVGDWHIKEHLTPFLGKSRPTELNRQTLLYGDSGNVLIGFGHWGEGHAPPPKAAIADVIKELRAKVTLRDLSDRWNSIANPSGANLRVPFPIGTKIGVAVSVELTPRHIQVSVKSPEVLGGLTFAFYLVQAGKRIDTRWYEKNASAQFQIDPIADVESYSIIAFVRDAFGGQESVAVAFPDFLKR